MAELNKVSRCYRCGAILQTDDPTAEGYISPEIVDKYPEGLLLCNHCYENERFNDHPQEARFEDDFQTILNNVKKTNGLIVYVVDLFSFEGSFISKLNDAIAGLDVLVVANKRDLMPKNANDEHLLKYVAHRLRVAKLNVKEVVLASSSTNYNIDVMYEKIIELANNRDVFFIGASVSGKSSLITGLLKRFKNQTRIPITVYTFKDTQIRGYRIPITNKNSIYELPGTDINNSMLSKVERSVQNAIMPKKAVVAKKINLQKRYSVALGGLAIIELINGKNTPAHFYVSSSVNVRTRRWNSEKHLKYILSKHNNKPCSNNFINTNEFDAYDFHITEEGNRDIGIAGLGWFSFKGNDQTFRIFVPKGVYVYTSRSKVINDK